MTDKEVGELWRDAIIMNGTHYWAAQCEALIRELVKERAWKMAGVYYKGLPTDGEEKTCYKAALRDFGIDPEQFEHEKGGIR